MDGGLIGLRLVTGAGICHIHTHTHASEAGDWGRYFIYIFFWLSVVLVMKGVVLV